MPKRLSRRWILLLFICLAHAGLIAALMQTLPLAPQVIGEYPPLLLTFINKPRSNADVHMDAVPPVERQAARRLNQSAPVTATAPPSISPSEPNWTEEANRAALDSLAHQAQENMWRSLIDYPKGMGQPTPPQTHELLETEHSEGGEMITWINDRCYITNEGVSLGLQHSTVKICKPRGGAFIEGDHIFESLKPSYLRDGESPATPAAR